MRPTKISPQSNEASTAHTGAAGGGNSFAKSGFERLTNAVRRIANGVLYLIGSFYRCLLSFVRNSLRPARKNSVDPTPLNSPTSNWSNLNEDIAAKIFCDLQIAKVCLLVCKSWKKMALNSLNSVKISRITPKLVEGLPMLKKISLARRMEIASHNWQLLLKLQHLEFLDLANGGSSVNDDALGVLKGLKKLCELNLNGCGVITDRGLSLIRDSPLSKSLETLHLLRCVLISDEGIKSLSKGKIADLRLSRNVKIHGQGLEQLASQSALPMRRLELHKWQLISFETVPLKRTRGNVELAINLSLFLNLQILIVSDSHLNDHSIWAISKSLGQLKILSLARCHNITWKGLYWIGEMNQLQRLSLENHYIADYNIKNMEHLQELQFLNLTNCVFLTPSCLNSLKALVKMQHIILNGCNKALSDEYWEDQVGQVKIDHENTYNDRAMIESAKSFNRKIWKSISAEKNSKSIEFKSLSRPFNPVGAGMR